MPNWCSGTIHVGIPTENVSKFLSYFIGSEDFEKKEHDEENPDFFYRTFYSNHTINSEENGITHLSVFFDCAWSCEGCLEYGKNIFDTKSDPCPILADVCKELKVDYLNGESEEPGMCFGESFEYDSEDECIAWEVFDITNYHCKDCEMFFSSREEEEAECPSCGQYIKAECYDEEDEGEEQE